MEPVAWTVDQDGRVTGWSVTWDAAGNPYQTELEVLEPAMNILSPLLFALAQRLGRELPLPRALYPGPAGIAAHGVEHP